MHVAHEHDVELLLKLQARFEQALFRTYGLARGPVKIDARRLPGARFGDRRRKTPLDKMHSGGHIDDRQYAAGQLLRNDWLIVAVGGGGANIAASAAVCTGAPVEFVMVDGEKRPVTFPPRNARDAKRGGGGDRPDHVLDASQKLKEAAKALPKGVYDLLVSFCAEERTLSDMASGSRARSQLSRKLRKGLDKLADHYNLAYIDKGRVMAAGTDDFRPVIMDVYDAESAAP